MRFDYVISKHFKFLLLSSSYKPSEDVRGAGKLSQDAIIGIVDLVESLHSTILRMGKLASDNESAKTKGITGFVYTSIRRVTELVGTGVDILLKQLADKVDSAPSSMQREAIISILNGVLGDYLDKNHNPLAIQMSLRSEGKPIDYIHLNKEIERSGNRLMILVHGLCMNDIQWSRKGMNYGSSLSEEFSIPHIHLHYNTGKHISENGEDFSQIMESLREKLPALSHVDIVTHSMGGLVTRSALHSAELNNRTWPDMVKKVVFLGTPHNGALLERAGNWFEMLLDNTPYTAPFIRVGRIRSNGITDLRYAYLVHEDWEGKNVFQEKGHPGKFLSLPKSIQFYAIAATTSKGEHHIGDHIIGDGLVTKSSAFGERDKTHQDLHIPNENKFWINGVAHLDLMCNPTVLEKVSSWLR